MRAALAFVRSSPIDRGLSQCLLLNMIKANRKWDRGVCWPKGCIQIWLTRWFGGSMNFIAQMMPCMCLHGGFPFSAEMFLVDSIIIWVTKILREYQVIGIGSCHEYWCQCEMIWPNVRQFALMLTHWGRVTHLCVSNFPSLVQIMACRLVSAKPLSKPMLEYC